MATFGFTSVYATEDYWGTGAIAVKVTMPEDGEISSISFYMAHQSIESTGVKAAVFSHNSGSDCPGSSLGVKERTFTGKISYAWQEFEFASAISVSKDDVLWLAVGLGNYMILFCRDSTDGQVSVMEPITYSTWPSSAWSEYTKYPGPFSIYATYTPGEAPPEPLTSAKYPQTTATTKATAPYDDDNWVNIGNITADDTSYAVITASSYDANDYSYLAKATNFGFTIPSTATIVGLEVETLSCTNAGLTAAQWAMMQLLNASGTAEGDNKGTGTLNRTTDAVNTFGGPTDKWGVSLTPAMVNDSDFGVQFAVQAKAANTDIRVEYLKMTVYYTAAEGTTLHNLMMMGAGTA